MHPPLRGRFPSGGTWGGQQGRRVPRPWRNMFAHGRLQQIGRLFVDFRQNVRLRCVVEDHMVVGPT